MSYFPRTLYDKLWHRRRVMDFDNDTSLIYVDRHIIHEVSSPQAFSGLRNAGRKPWQSKRTIATPDHNVPTDAVNRYIESIEDPLSRIQVRTLDDNCNEFDIPHFDLLDERQGIVHVMAPEQGMTLPGTVVVCGDSHTATHGAFAALGIGIGTSEVEHVLATSCLVQRKAQNMRIEVSGDLISGVSAKDLALYVIGEIGTAAGTGFSIEFTGDTIEALSMEARMTLCNLAIEAGARTGLVAFDEVTERYLMGRPYSPRVDDWDKAVECWRTLRSDAEASFDRVHRIDATVIKPQVTWGTSPDMVVAVDETVPDPAEGGARAADYAAALNYMGLRSGQKISDIQLDRVFIGSCTNSRIEDLREVSRWIAGQRVNARIKQALIVPGSGLVKRQAEAEGLDKLFIQAGFEWRQPGCSMCVAMNADRLGAKEHAASTSNRNFVGRQGPGGRTHLVSPAMAAAAAIAGRFVDISVIGKQR